MEGRAGGQADRLLLISLMNRGHCVTTVYANYLRLMSYDFRCISQEARTLISSSIRFISQLSSVHQSQTELSGAVIAG